MIERLRRHPEPWIRAALVLAVVAVYAQVVGHEFINFDDPEYVTDNPAVRAGLSLDGIRWAFTGTAAANWHPLTWLSHMLDVSLFGLRPGAFLLENVAFHAVNAVLLFEVLVCATRRTWPSAFVAAAFALHPLRVESVAWISERKDLLGALFWLLTMAAYLRYTARPTPGRYALVAASLAASLCAKPMAVTLPVVLLLLDWWPLDRTNRVRPLRLVLEKLPLLALSAAASVVTVFAQREGDAVASLSKMGVVDRITNALVGYVRYLGKVLWPHPLAVVYPLHLPIPPWQIAGAAAILVAITVAAVSAARRWPYLAVGWLWYLGTLVPVIGVVQVGEAAIADRYTYIPTIGLALMVAWGAADLVGVRRRGRMALAAVALTVLGAWSATAWAQIGRWHDSVTLLEHTLRVTTANYPAQYGLGLALADRGDVAAAVPHYAEAVRLDPELGQAHFQLGMALGSLGRLDEAFAHLREAVRLRPDIPEIQAGFGAALGSRGDLAEAIVHLARAVEEAPTLAPARYSLALALLATGRTADAVTHLRAVLATSPEWTEAAKLLAWTLATNPDPLVRNPAEAVRIAESANAGTGGRDPDVLDTLGAAYAAAGRFADAIRIAESAQAMARAGSSPDLAAKIGAHLERYRAGAVIVDGDDDDDTP